MNDPKMMSTIEPTERLASIRTSGRTEQARLAALLEAKENDHAASRHIDLPVDIGVVYEEMLLLKQAQAEQKEEIKEQQLDIKALKEAAERLEDENEMLKEAVERRDQEMEVLDETIYRLEYEIDMTDSNLDSHKRDITKLQSAETLNTRRIRQLTRGLFKVSDGGNLSDRDKKNLRPGMSSKTNRGPRTNDISG